MIVTITNKLKGVIDASALKEADCKYAIGCYSTHDCVKTLSNYSIDYLVIDITAIKDAFEISAWKQFKDFFDPEKTIILLDNTKSYSNVGFLSMLISMGFYNFTKTSEGLVRLIERPNTYQDVAKYQQMELLLEDRKEKKEEQISDYQQRLGETKELMIEYRESQQNGEDTVDKKRNVLKMQLKVGLLILPLLTFISVIIIYLFQILISNWVPAVDDFVGEYLYGELWNTGFTPLIIIGILLVMIIFMIYYSYLNANIKRKQMTRTKFIIIPFALFCMLLFGEYYLLGILENLYDFIKFIPMDDKPFLYQDLYCLSRWVASAAILLYFASTFVNNSRTIKFEKDLSQNLTLLEKFWIIDMLLLILIPIAYQISRAFPTTNIINEFFSNIYDKSLIMMIIVGVEIILTLLILFQPKFMKEKEYEILKEEDL